MGIHQLTIEDSLLSQYADQRHRMEIEIDETIDRVAQAIDSMRCIDLEIRHSEALADIMRELGHLRAVGHQICVH